MTIGANFVNISFRNHSGQTMDFSHLTVTKLKEALKREGVEVLLYFRVKSSLFVSLVLL